MICKDCYKATVKAASDEGHELTHDQVMKVLWSCTCYPAGCIEHVQPQLDRVFRETRGLPTHEVIESAMRRADQEDSSCDEWASTPTQTDVIEDWLESSKADRMLLLAGRLVDRKLLVLATCDCVRLTSSRLPVGDPCFILALETAEAWARGEASIENVRAVTKQASKGFDGASDADKRATFAAVRAGFTVYSEYPEHIASSAVRAACVSDDEMQQAADLVRKRIPFTELTKVKR